MVKQEAAPLLLFLAEFSSIIDEFKKSMSEFFLVRTFFKLDLVGISLLKLSSLACPGSSGAVILRPNNLV